MSDFEVVEQAELLASVQKPATRGRTSEGAELVQKFLSAGVSSGRKTFGDDDEAKKKRDSIALSASNFVRNAMPDRVWIKKERLATTGAYALLLIDLENDETPDEVREAYKTRPRPGRKAASK